MGSYIHQHPPPSLNYRRSGVQDWTKKIQARAKLRESRGGETLGEDVSKLGGGRDMEYPNIADGDPVGHEVQVDLHMLHLLMLNGVGGEIQVDERALGERVVELRQELS